MRDPSYSFLSCSYYEWIRKGGVLVYSSRYLDKGPNLDMMERGRKIKVGRVEGIRLVHEGIFLFFRSIGYLPKWVISRILSAISPAKRARKDGVIQPVSIPVDGESVLTCFD